VIFHEQIVGDAEVQNVLCYACYQKVHYCDHKSPLLYSDPVPPSLRQNVTFLIQIEIQIHTALADVFESVDGA